jgi:hypothetical protein
MKEPHNTPGVLYEVSLNIEMYSEDKRGRIISLRRALQNGRGSYIFFQIIAAAYAGLSNGTEGNGSDLVMEDTEEGYEVKAYADPQDYPRSEHIVHCGPSSLFANNSGAREYKKLLNERNFAAAMLLAHDKGYSKNDFYLFTNTAKYKSDFFRYLIIKRDDLMKIVIQEDPVKVTRKALLATATKKVTIA